MGIAPLLRVDDPHTIAMSADYGNDIRGVCSEVSASFGMEAVNPGGLGRQSLPFLNV
jgi:hypothetical protein